MENKKIKLSTQKKFIFVPFSPLLISLFMYINLKHLTVKESFKTFSRLIPVIMVNFIFIIFFDNLNVSEDVEMIAICILVYLSQSMMSWILIKCQEKISTQREEAVVNTQKKQVNLSTQKKLLLIPFVSFFIIYILTCNNLEPLTSKERFNMNLRVVLAVLAISPFLILSVYFNNSNNLFSENLLAVIILAYQYVMSITVSLVLIMYQKKMGVK